jgi:hypothetical protein
MDIASCFAVQPLGSSPGKRALLAPADNKGIQEWFPVMNGALKEFCQRIRDVPLQSKVST